MSGDRPEVGVIVPCHNQGRFAAESVGSALAQEYPRCRVVLLDDASTDGTSRNDCLRLAGPRVDVVCLDRNLGRASVRNRGLVELAAVDYVLMLDCDDRLSPAYVGKLVETAEADPGLGVAYGTLHPFGDVDRPAGRDTWPTREWSAERMYLDNVVPGPGALFRRRALAETAGWRADFNASGAEDFDISLQVLELGWRPAWRRDAIFHYRRHAASSLATKGKDRHQLVELNILRHHRAGIRASCGVAAYLRRRLLPDLLAALRGRDGATLRRLVPPLLRLCPGTLVSLLAGHYARRVVATLSSDSRAA